MIEKKVAIVGASEDKWRDELQKIRAKQVILRFFDRGMILISGGCPKGGVDIWAEEIADGLSGVEKIIFKPEINQWEDKDGRMGYKSRNMKIAEECDMLFDIEPDGKRSGGTWTLEYAKKIGKKTVKIIIG